MSTPGGGSAHWDDVARVVRQSRRRLDEFDPEADPRMVACREGIAPIVTLYVSVTRTGGEFSDVERSLLSGALNDWLDAYGRCIGSPPPGEFSLHEVAIRCARAGDVDEAVETLLDDGEAATRP